MCGGVAVCCALHMATLHRVFSPRWGRRVTANMDVDDTHTQMGEEMGPDGHPCISGAFLLSLNAATLTASTEATRHAAMDADIHRYIAPTSIQINYES